MEFYHYHNNKRVRIKTRTTNKAAFFLSRFIRDFGLGYAVIATVVIVFGLIGFVFNILWIIEMNK